MCINQYNFIEIDVIQDVYSAREKSQKHGIFLTMMISE